MKKQGVIGVLSVLLSSYCYAKILGPIENPIEKGFEGCGCTFDTPEKKTYLWSTLGEYATSNKIVINLNGKDLVLEKKETEFPDTLLAPKKRPPKDGHSVKEVFLSKEWRAKLVFYPQKTCKGCEYKNYRLDLQIENLSKKGDVDSITLNGNCGC